MEADTRLCGQLRTNAILERCRTQGLTNAKWKRILEFLRSDPSVYVKDEAECRKFIEAIVLDKQNGSAVERTCRRSSASLTACSGVSLAGRKREYGSGCICIL